MLKMPKKVKQEPETVGQTGSEIGAAKKRVRMQAALAILTIAVTVVLVFAMTQAWYTNVIESTGLTFETEAWGFDGTVTVNDEATMIEPGKSGVVSLSVDNSTNTDYIFASMSISKSEMTNTEMKSRLYFYADTSATVNGETSDRIYLNSETDYSYLILGGDTLTLSDEYMNDVALKWEWVYDVVGYYFEGTVTGSSADLKVTINDYLRPVEYDLDAATFDDDGNLLTPDGETDVQTFLASLSSTDGYEKDIQYGSGVNGYYPVEVDGAGTGVWVHLCTLSEIQQATAWDTKVGRGEITVSETVKLTITAQNANQTNSTTVATGEDLAAALTSGDDTVVVSLSDDISVSSAVNVEAGTAVIDLNGNTLTMETSTSTIYATEGAEVVVTNGTVEGGGGVAFRAADSSLVLDDVTMTGASYAVVVQDTDGDSVVRLTDCSLETTATTVLLQGNGSVTEANTVLIVDGCTINSGYIGISGNGTNKTGDERWGTEIQILNSTVKGLWAGIYQPQESSTLTVYKSEISGVTGMAIKGGTVRVTDSTVLGTGTADQIQSLTTPSTNGFLDSGAGIYVETNYGWDIDVTVSGSDTMVSSASSQAIVVFPTENVDWVTVSVLGGTYSSSVSEWLKTGYSQSSANGYYTVTGE
ncbi:MAG: hypothetical protein LUB60_05425 [Clostridiales bacterium]|nr:hypothetical protein [Clostridiales bacterium]